MEAELTPRQAAEQLLALQSLAVLATIAGDRPYTSLVAFAATPDLRTVVFATTRATRKFSNLVANSAVSLMVDSRSNSESDLHLAAAITLLGVGEEVSAEDRPKWAEMYLQKLPELRDFLASPTTAIVGVKVERAILVRRFQEVFELVLP